MIVWNHCETLTKKLIWYNKKIKLKVLTINQIVVHFNRQLHSKQKQTVKLYWLLSGKQKYNFQKYNFHSSQNCVSTFRGENFREEFCIRRNVHFQLKSFYFCSKIISLAQGNPNFHFDVPYLQCDQKKLPNVHKSCLKMISLEKW